LIIDISSYHNVNVNDGYEKFERVFLTIM